MRRSLGSAAVIVGALAVALVFVVLAVAPSSAGDDPSSRVAGRAGTLALHDWLDRLGFTTHRISGQFTTANSDVVFILDPTTAISGTDGEALVRFARNGGDVVLAVSPARAPMAASLLSALGLELSGGPVPGGDSAPAEPFDAADRVHRVPMASTTGIDPAPTAAPLLVQGRALTAVVEKVGGGGRVYVVASPFPFSNDGLRDGDSSMLVLSILERARGGRLAFDEYHHGEQAQAAGGAAAIFQSPLGLALLLAVAALVAYLMLSGRRLGRPLPAGDPGEVPTTGAYVDAMAGLYARSRHRGAVAAQYAVELKQRVGSLAGVDAALDDTAFAEALRRLGRDEGDVRELLARARHLAQGSPEPAQLLALARDVDATEAAWAAPTGLGTRQ